METSYNIAINDLKLRKMEAEREVCAVISERDRLSNEISELRRAYTVVAKEKNDIEDRIQKLREAENAEILTLAKFRKEFAESVTREADRKRAVNAEILALEEANAKAERFEDYSKQNKLAKTALEAAWKQFEKAKKDAWKLIDERTAFEREKSDTRQALDEEREKYEGYSRSLEKREERIALTEKRLENYKAELLSKK